MDLYKILGVDSNADQRSIKKAYSKLVLKYHPDKNIEHDSSLKFREIQLAYEILYDEKRREEYDRMNTDEKNYMYDTLQQYLYEIDPTYVDTCEFIIKMFYGDEQKFKDDINEMDFGKIYHTFKTSFQENYQKWLKSINNSNIDSPKNSDGILKNNNDDTSLDVRVKLYTDLRDKYMDRYKKTTIKIKGLKEKREIYVPLRESEIIFPELGEINHTTEKKGDLIVNVICHEHPKFKIKDEYDLTTIQKISLYEYLYGGSTKIEHLDGEIVELFFDSMVNKPPFLRLENRGLPISKTDDTKDDGTDSYEYINNNLSDSSINYGDLFIKLVVDIDNCKMEDIKHLMYETFFPNNN